MSKPVVLSNNNAGPPPDDLHARSVTAAISRSGLTDSPIRASSLRFSRSARKSVRSAYMRCVFVHARLDSICDLLREHQRAATLLAGHRRRALRPHRLEEVDDFTFERLFVRDFHLAALNRRNGAFDQPPDLELLGGVVDRHVGGRLKE